jgi:ABC-type phosphate transport system substrate-binding protein
MKPRQRHSVPRYRPILIALLVTALHVAATGQVAVIANKSVPVSSIERSALLDIYSLSTHTWDDGSAIVVVTMKGNDGIVKKFHRFIHSTPFEMRKVWMRAQLSGEGRVPIALASEMEVAEKVASTPGAIGFVSAGHVPAGVITLAIIE